MADPGRWRQSTNPPPQSYDSDRNVAGGFEHWFLVSCSYSLESRSATERNVISAPHFSIIMEQQIRLDID